MKEKKLWLFLISASIVLPLLFALLFVTQGNFLTWYMLFFFMLGAPIVVGVCFELLGLFPSVDPEGNSTSSLVYGIVIYYSGVLGSSVIEEVFYSKPACYVISFAASILICWIYWNNKKIEWLKREAKRNGNDGHNT